MQLYSNYSNGNTRPLKGSRDMHHNSHADSHLSAPRLLAQQPRTPHSYPSPYESSYLDEVPVTIFDTLA